VGGDIHAAVFSFLREQAIDPIEIVEEVEVSIEGRESLWISTGKRELYCMQLEKGDPTVYRFLQEKGIDPENMDEPEFLRYRLVFKRSGKPFFQNKADVYVVMRCFSEYLYQAFVPTDSWTIQFDTATTTICIQFRCDYGS